MVNPSSVFAPRKAGSRCQSEKEHGKAPAHPADQQAGEESR